MSHIQDRRIDLTVNIKAYLYGDRGWLVDIHGFNNNTSILVVSLISCDELFYLNCLGKIQDKIRNNVEK